MRDFALISEDFLSSVTEITTKTIFKYRKVGQIWTRGIFYIYYIHNILSEFCQFSCQNITKKKDKKYCCGKFIYTKNYVKI